MKFKPPTPSKRQLALGEHETVSRSSIRDGFIAQADKATDADNIELWVQIGRVVINRWYAETKKIEAGQELEEHEIHHSLWETMTKGDLEKLRAEALIQLKNHRRDWLWKHPFDVILSVLFHAALRFFARVPSWLGWLGKEMLKGPLAAFGLIMFGWLLTLALPKILPIIRVTVQDALAIKHSENAANAAENR